MFGRKTGFFAVMALTVMLLGGCGTTANNLGGATDGYSDVVYGNNYRGNMGNGYGYWDGYGVNNGRAVTEGSTDRNSYGMRKGGWEIGNGVGRASEDVTSGAAVTNNQMS